MTELTKGYSIHYVETMGIVERNGNIRGEYLTDMPAVSCGFFEKLGRDVFLIRAEAVEAGKISLQSKIDSVIRKKTRLEKKLLKLK